MRSGSIHFFLQHIYLKKTNLIISGQDITGDYMSSAIDSILHTQPLSLVIDQWFASFSDISREHFFVGVKEFFLSVGEICGEHLLVFGGDLQDLGRCRAASSASRPPPRNAGCHWDLQAFFCFTSIFFLYASKVGVILLYWLTEVMFIVQAMPGSFVHSSYFRSHLTWGSLLACQSSIWLWDRWPFLN